VNIKYIIELLKIEVQLPWEEQEFLRGVCRETPKLPQEKKLDESEIERKQSINASD